SGFAGVELMRLLARHPSVRLLFGVSDRLAGRRIAELTADPSCDLSFETVERGVELAAECGAVFLATPAKVSLELAPRLLERGCKVIDLSGAFRLTDAATFERAYGLQPAPDALLAQAV